MQSARLSSGLLLAMLGMGGCAPATIDALTEVDVPLLPQNTTTKFLHWGAGQPAGTAELAWFVTHLPEIEASPFDGTVLDMGVATAWLETDLTEAGLTPAAELLRTAPFQMFTENFQRLGFVSLNFGDDASWDRIVRNSTLLAAVARRAGLRGFLLDTQEYADYHFSYARLPVGKGSFAEEGARFLARGQQLMRALLAGYPELVLLHTLGTSDVFREVCISGKPLEGSDYALLPAFLDGMQAARAEARTGALLIDAFLPAYSTRDPSAFRLYHDLIHGDWQAMQAHWLPGVVTYRWATMASDQSLGESAWPSVPALLCTEAERQLLTRDVRASFAVMLDYPHPPSRSEIFQTEPARFNENSHSPAQYTELLRSALQASDKYVWSWTSGVLWWPKPGDTRPLMPAPYVEAARLALEQARQPQAVLATSPIQTAP